MAIDTDPKKIARQQRDQGDFKGAVRTLREAIDMAGAELADLHGLMGGTRRQQGDLAAAASAYDTGFHLDESYHAASSYNALNRLVTRVLLEPGSLLNPELLREKNNLEFVDVQQALSGLQKQLERQVKGKRSNDFWCAGDLAVTAALNGDLRSAARAVKRFDACSPPAYARDAYRQTLAALAKLETPRKEALMKVDALLIFWRRASPLLPP
jgi:hypothetical protein